MSVRLKIGLAATCLLVVAIPIVVQGAAGAAGVVSVASYNTSTFGPIDLVANKSGIATFTSFSPAIGKVRSNGAVSTLTTGLNSGSRPNAIANGLNGTHWFADQGTTPAIGELTEAGKITEYSSGLTAGKADSLILGPDGNIWFGQCGAIGTITPAGHITEYTFGFPSDACVFQLVVGENGNVWFYAEGLDPNPQAPFDFGQITTAGSISTYRARPSTGVALAPSPKGGVWFTASPYGTTEPGAVGRVTAGGVVRYSTGLNPGSSPTQIIVADHDAWFVDEGTTPAIGRMTAAGVVTEFSAGLPGGSSLTGIAFDAEDLWSLNRGTTPGVVEITTSGAITQDSSGLPSGFAQMCYQIVPSGSAQLWFYQSADAGVIGKITIG